MQKIKLYLIFLTVILISSLIVLAWLINAYPPEQINYLLLFYFLVALIGFALFTLIGFYLRKLFGQRELLNTYIGSAVRQGIWLALILVTALLLVHLNLFSWINATLLVMTFVFFESYLLTKNKNFPNDRES